jgi:membrane protease YdiL (CAAX protease family)
MNPITSFIKRHPQVTFWGIAYLIAGVGFPLSMMYPSELWGFVIWGITLGGALVTGIVDGRTGLKTYFSRIVRVQAGIQWYAIALLTPFVLAAIAYGLNILTGAQVSGELPEFGKAAVLFVLFLLTNAGEEPGFRGFSLPLFMKTRSAFTASLIVGVLHAIWHLPLFIAGQMPLVDFLQPLCGAFLFTWIFNNTNGSVFLAMLLHASNDVAGGFFGSVFTGTGAAVFHYYHAGAFVVLVILLRVFAGRELSRKVEPGMDTMGVEQPAMAR